MKTLRGGLRILVAIFFVLGLGCSLVFAEYTDNKNGTVTDTTTGLIWQKTDNSAQVKWAGAGPYCDNLVLGGYYDWRLPRIDELRTIVDFGRYRPAIDPVFSAQRYQYWSSTTAVHNTDSAWIAHFEDGIVKAYNKSYYVGYVRCVRGEPLWSLDPVGHLEAGGTNTVRDTLWDKVWQKSDDGVYRTWNEAQSYCSNLQLDGYSDWRLPSIQELQTILDYTTYYPSLSTQLFKSSWYYYWTGTTHIGRPTCAWDAVFNYGYTEFQDKTSSESCPLREGRHQ